MGFNEKQMDHILQWLAWIRIHLAIPSKTCYVSRGGTLNPALQEVETHQLKCDISIGSEVLQDKRDAQTLAVLSENSKNVTCINFTKGFLDYKTLQSIYSVIPRMHVMVVFLGTLILVYRKAKSQTEQFWEC